MYKVKIFKGFNREEEKLEEQINNFLENQSPQFELINIKYNTTKAIDAHEPKYQYLVMIIYYFR